MSIDDITTGLRNFLGEKQLLIEAITRAFREGTEAKPIARLVAPAFGRDQVLQYLAAVALHDSARTALAETGLDSLTGLSVTGIEAPREARLHLTADPQETDGYTLLPARVRAALRDFHITLDLPRGEHDDVTDDLIDDLLRDGEPVRLVKAKPRT
ncbi:hypothetical protein ACFVZ3_08325 [Kitasatospora purpeofusca]|uniref:hypothetical protein n=1 Tax=Kitasatospora purpeofusca TaxID=67352 RepID=UPI0036B8C38A